MIIRRATIDDSAALAELAAITFTQTFGHLYPPADLKYFLKLQRNAAVYRHKLQETGAAAWVAQDANSVLRGYALAGPCHLPVADLEADAGELRELYMLADTQGQGLGSQLLEQALNWLRLESRRPLYVGVWSLNTGAQRLYQRYGFVKVGEYDYPVGQTLDREFILRRD
jgi:ribosomal protein S18 acetylase RimI-like enzyme